METQEAAISLTGILRKNLYWITGAILTILVFVFVEGTLIATTKIFGVTKATLIRVTFTIPLSWLVIFLSTKSKKNVHFGNWLTSREAKLSRKAQIAVEGGKFIAVVNTAIFFGPIIASILMLMVGLKARRVYIYAVLCAFLSAGLWCAFYSGMLCGFGRLFCR